MANAESHSKPRDTWSATLYNTHAPFVYSAAFTSPVLELLVAKPGERIFDFGCGSGELTVELQRAVGEEGLVVGVDSSENMISQARANGLTHALVSDIQDFHLPASAPHIQSNTFDAVFSNAAFHWCKRDPRGVLESAKRVLKPNGGRLVGEMGGYMNCIGIRSALHQVLRRRGHDPASLDPWYFPSVPTYTALLTSAGFTPTSVSLHPRLTPLPGPLIDWLRLFARPSFLGTLSDEEAEEVMREVQDMCEVDCKDEDGRWSMMYTRLRFAAVLAGATEGGDGGLGG